MYSVRVRDSVMIAHSLPDPFFGPAQRLHGATFVVDVQFMSPRLNAFNVVIDIGVARTTVAEVLDGLRYQNLDELPEFEGVLSTAEHVAKHIHDLVKDRLGDRFSGALEVTLRETHDAWASYRGPDAGAPG
ncbi:MAG: 6-carboxytetrahydropterin synthase [Pseudomonadota bacterium]